MMAVTILDGGIGHLLKQRNVRTRIADTDFSSSFLVAAFANIDAPDAVRDIHREYIDVGSDVITVNNFPLTAWSLGRVQQESLTLSSLTHVSRRGTTCPLPPSPPMTKPRFFPACSRIRSRNLPGVV